MALPVRVQRGQAIDPFDIVRNDLNMLGRFLGFGADTGDGGNALGSLSDYANYGVDVREDADHIYVIADLPGFRKEDVDISLEDGTLTITAERQEEITEPSPQQQGQQAQRGRQSQAGQGAQAQQGQGQPQAGTQQQAGQQAGQQAPQAGQQQGKQQNSNYLLRERRVMRFVRSFTLPPNVDESNVQAKLENGVLTVTLNKREESKPKRIAVS